jgi:hypothetical protein
VPAVQLVAVPTASSSHGLACPRTSRGRVVETSIPRVAAHGHLPRRGIDQAVSRFIIGEGARDRVQVGAETSEIDTGNPGARIRERDARHEPSRRDRTQLSERRSVSGEVTVSPAWASRRTAAEALRDSRWVIRRLMISVSRL